MAKRLGHLFGCGADVEHHRATVRNQYRRRQADALLLRAALLSPRGVIPCCHRIKLAGTAMRPLQEPLCVKISKILPDGLRGDPECPGEAIDLDAAGFADQPQNFVMTFDD